MNYIGVVISDEHFGVMDSKKLLNEHELNFFNIIKTMEKLDFIIIDGDFFDRNLCLNDEEASYAILCMKMFIHIAKKFHAKIRIVYGTESHECNQYRIFKMYEYEVDPDIDFKVIYYASEEELLPGLNVLYVPEEYIYDKNEYYQEFLSKENHYDYVFGHGIIQEVMSDAVRGMSKSKATNRAKVPVFNTSELSYICKGHVYFGHYHVNTNINDKVFYVGSFSRWIHGEEKDKGFYIIKTNGKKYSNEFIVNQDADKYKTFAYGYTHEVFSSMEKMIEEMDWIESLLKEDIYQYIRLMINIPENYENPEFLINYLKERFKFNKFIKFEIVNGYIDKKKKIDREKLNSLSTKYSIIFDKSVPIEDKYSFFIKEKKGVELSPDKIGMYLKTTDIIKLGKE